MWNEQTWLAGDRAPVRDIHRGLPGYYTICFPSLKNHNVVLCEGSLEAAYCVWLEWDPDVIAYYPQPYTFTWETDRGLMRYTPDFFVLHEQATNHFTEVKSDFQQLKEPTRFKLESFVVQCQAWQIEWRRADKQQLTSPPVFANLRYLYFHGFGVNDREQAYLIDFLSCYPRCFTLGEILNSAYPPSLRAVYHGLFRGELSTDLNQPLSRHSLVQQRTL
ncbi:hypothetical protein PGC34_20040 [Pseudomonas kribbensis]|uniref:TnsA endonuclease N-terminal domain-containing protein n=1 Tax=Pseudomonas kribbensis TaxID=1628086 RepID=UPI003BF873E6